MQRAIFALLIFVIAAVGDEISPPAISKRDANISDVPYMLSFEENGRSECGAAIIGDEWVISAAHCRVNERDKGLFRAGSEIKGFGGDIHEILEEVVHPDFNSPETLNDFALYRVYPPFMLTSKVNKGYEGVSNDKWQLQTVNRRTTCPEVCLLELGTKLNVDGTLCVKAVSDVEDCEGEEGGPLVVDGVLVGIATWQTIICRGEGKPTIFEKVSPVREWIRTVTGE